MTVTTEEFSWENMKSGIESQAAFLHDKPREIFASIQREIVVNFVPSRIYLVGCGDSWSSGLAAFPAFESYTGIPTTPCQSMLFSRYLVHSAPKESLVILISNSGKVSRTIEAALQA